MRKTVQNMRTRLALCLTLGLLAVLPPARLLASDGPSEPDAKEVKAVVAKGVAYLRGHQADNGSFSTQLAGPGVSAVVATSLLRNGVGLNDPMMAKLMAYLKGQARWRRL